jgi:iron complex transport system substrate-binding protein
MRLSRSSRGLAWMLAAALAVSAAVPASAADTTITDAGGRQVQVADASRILCIGGDITEIVYALGAGSRIVAVDTTSQLPEAALKEKKSVGYMRALSSEGVISVDATVVLASERSGPPEVVKTLKTTSIPYVEVPDGYAADDIADKVRLIARVIGAETEGDRVVRQIEADFAALAERRAKIKQPLRALFVLAIQNGRVTVGGQSTSADAILRLAGAENVAAAVTGFRPLPNEAIVELAPEVVVGMRRTDSGAHDAEQLFAIKGFESTPAGINRRIVVMDGLYLLGFGPRAPAAARDLLGKLYPDLADAGAGAGR